MIKITRRTVNISESKLTKIDEISIAETRLTNNLKIQQIWNTKLTRHCK